MSLLRLAYPLVAFLLVGACAAEQPAAPSLPTSELVVTTDAAEHTFAVEVVDTAEERSRGLMYRRELGADAGMLFDFKTEIPASFWMKNTYIPLDMLFIRADGEIESIAERTTPLSERSVESKGPVRYVLEINGGRSDELGITAGDRVSGPALDVVE